MLHVDPKATRLDTLLETMLPVLQSALVFSGTELGNTKLIGRYEYGIDFEISIQPSNSIGNNYVYKDKSSGRPLYAFVLGEVVNQKASQAGRIEVCKFMHTAQPTSSHAKQPTSDNEDNISIVLKSISGATFKGRQSYITDAITLVDIMHREGNNRGRMTRKRADGRTPLQRTMIWASARFTLNAEGGLRRAHRQYRGHKPDAGDVILVEVTLHRYDELKAHPSEESKHMTHTYSLAGHYVEVADKQELVKRGVILGDD
ncbi:hypothetical protein C8J57DRAFT_1260843 [Mycena rebaudengoi]|nr:hypothetical protein C8J57DRAFT_1260843 [Mycena rebaudengoi]